MPKAKLKAKPSEKKKTSLSAVLPLFTFTVSVVFSFLYTVIMSYLQVVESDVKVMFIMMLIVSNTAASTVALVFFLYFDKRLRVR